MKVTVKIEPNCRRILEIEVPGDDIETEIKNQLFDYRSRAKIPGFRPGKAPLELVKSRFIDSIKADAIETVLPKALSDAIRQENLHPIGEPVLSDIDFGDGKPLKFKARIEIRPEMKIKDYKGLKLERKVRQITDADIDESLKQLQKRYAEYFPVDRKCHDNDLVVVDLIKKYDKLKKIKEDKIENLEIDLENEQVLKEFKEGLRGMGVGEMKEIEVKYPEDYEDQNLAGNEARYMAVIKEVKEKKLPELNDEFAKNFAQLDSFEELKKKLRESLERKAEEDADQALKSDIIGRITKSNRFEVPESMIERYLQAVTEDFKKRYKEVDELQLRQSYRPVGEDTIRWQLIFREIAEIEKLTIDEKDRSEWVKQFARSFNMSEEAARESLGKAGKFEDIDDILLEKKVLDFIKENSKISS